MVPLFLFGELLPTQVVPPAVSIIGATRGGNVTLIGVSANIVSVGICASHGERVSFGRLMRYRVPITVVQLCLGAVHVHAMAALSR